MGNCLVLEENIGIVMKTDGHKSTIKVDQVLSKFSHATPDQLPVVKHMHPNHLHCLVPQSEPPRPIKTMEEMKKKSVRFSDKGGLGGGEQASGVVRIKVVISKKELQKMVSEGEVSVDGMILKVQNQEITNKAFEYRDHGVISKGRFPPLETIPEID